MLLTDFCNRLTNRALVDRSTPESAAFTARTDDRALRVRRRRPALRRSGPPVEACLTARQELRSSRPPALQIWRPEPSRAVRPRRFRPRDGLATDLWRSLSPSERDRRSPCASGALGSIPSRARQSSRLSRPEAPSLDRCSEEPATVARGFAAAIRLPTLVRSSSLSREGLDLEPSSFHPKGLAAEHRLSTSAIVTIRDRDLGLDRTPLTAQAIACLCSSSRALALQRLLDPAGGLDPARFLERAKPTEIPRDRGGRRILRSPLHDRS